MKVTLNLSQIAEGRITLEDINPATLIDEFEHAYRDDPALASALNTVAHLVGASNGGGTGTGRNNHNWNATPERRFLKCLAGVLVRQGLARSELLLKFNELIPDFQTFFDHPVTDSAVWGRADTGRRPRYRSEWPNVNPATVPYWGLAQQVVANDKPLSADAVRTLVASVNAAPEQIATEPTQEQPEAAAFGSPWEGEKKSTDESPSEAPRAAE
jgi:hypothetical protein